MRGPAQPETTPLTKMEDMSVKVQGKERYVVPPFSEDHAAYLHNVKAPSFKKTTKPKRLKLAVDVESEISATSDSATDADEESHEEEEQPDLQAVRLIPLY